MKSPKLNFLFSLFGVGLFTCIYGQSSWQSLHVQHNSQNSQNSEITFKFKCTIQNSKVLKVNHIEFSYFDTKQEDFNYLSQFPINVQKQKGKRYCEVDVTLPYLTLCLVRIEDEVIMLLPNNKEEIVLQIDFSKKPFYQLENEQSNSYLIQRYLIDRENIMKKLELGNINVNRESIFNQFLQDSAEKLNGTLALSVLVLDIDEKISVDTWKNIYKKIDSLINNENRMYLEWVREEIKRYIETYSPNLLDIELPDIDGNYIKVSSLKSKYILIQFWASGCEVCKEENEKLKELYNMYKNKGLEVYAISIDSNRENWVNATKEIQKTLWINVIDEEQAMAKKYNIVALPTNFLIDNQGNIIAKNIYINDFKEKTNRILKY